MSNARTAQELADERERNKWPSWLASIAMRAGCTEGEYRRLQDLAALASQAEPVAWTIEQRERVRRKIMDGMNQRVPQRFNEWRGWPGTWTLADCAVSVFAAMFAPPAPARAESPQTGDVPDVYWAVDSILSKLEDLKHVTPHEVDSIWGERYAELVEQIEQCKEAISATPAQAEQSEDGRDAALLRWLGASDWYVGPDTFYADEAGKLHDCANKNQSLDALRSAIRAAIAVKEQQS